MLCVCVLCVCVQALIQDYLKGGWLGALEIHSFDIPLNIDNICEASKELQSFYPV